jgi:hypothetical protein
MQWAWSLGQYCLGFVISPVWDGLPHARICSLINYVSGRGIYNGHLHIILSKHFFKGGTRCCWLIWKSPQVLCTLWAICQGCFELLQGSHYSPSLGIFATQCVQKSGTKCIVFDFQLLIPYVLQSNEVARKKARLSAEEHYLKCTELFEAQDATVELLRVRLERLSLCETIMKGFI